MSDAVLRGGLPCRHFSPFTRIHKHFKGKTLHIVRLCITDASTAICPCSMNLKKYPIPLNLYYSFQCLNMGQDSISTIQILQVHKFQKIFFHNNFFSNFSPPKYVPFGGRFPCIILRTRVPKTGAQTLKGTERTLLPVCFCLRESGRKIDCSEGQNLIMRDTTEQ